MSKSELTKFYLIVGTAAVLGVGVVGWSQASKARDKAMVKAPVAITADHERPSIDLARPVTKGDPNAPFTIIEFADFQCPYCAEFFAQVEPLIESEFIATGKAKFEFYDFPLTSIHPNAFLAARAGRCAEDQQKFWVYHDVLYRTQHTWVGAKSPAGQFEDYAGAVGMDLPAFAACLRSAEHADLVMAQMELASQFQVPGTPTLMVAQGKGMGRRVDGTIESIREAIEMTERPDR